MPANKPDESAHLFVQELQVGCVLILDLGRQLLLFVQSLLTSPVGLLISPLLFVPVFIRATELEVVTKRFFTILWASCQHHKKKREKTSKLTLDSAGKGPEQLRNA